LARRAWPGLGQPADAAVLRPPPIDREFTPRPAAQVELAPRLDRFRRAYAPLRELAH
jgi:hypothetical protein